jgi:hypothetical protein
LSILRPSFVVIGYSYFTAIVSVSHKYGASIQKCKLTFMVKKVVKVVKVVTKTVKVTKIKETVKTKVVKKTNIVEKRKEKR